MTFHIYAPNISKENLQGLLYLQLGCLGSRISIEINKKKAQFRAPEMTIRGSGDLSSEDTATMLVGIFEVARTLGGTRFVFLEKGEPLSQLDANDKSEKVMRVAKDVCSGAFDKIEIY